MRAALLALLAVVVAAPALAADPRIDAAAAKVEALWAALPNRTDFASAEASWKRRVAEMCPTAEINCTLAQYDAWAQFLEEARPRKVQGATFRSLSDMRWSAEAGYTIDLAYPEFVGTRFTELNRFAADDARRRADALAAEWSANGAAARAFWIAAPGKGEIRPAPLRLAGPGEVLVSGTTHDLLAGSGLQFEDRGTAELRGLSGPRPIFALRRE
jgi:hypothetical protein